MAWQADNAVAVADLLSPQQAEALVGQVLPAAIEPSEATMFRELEVADPSLKPTRGRFEFADNTVEGAIARDVAHGATMGPPTLAITMMPEHVAATASSALRVAAGDGVIYANTGPASDTIIRPIVQGIEFFTQIRGADGAERYSWIVQSDQGGSLAAERAGTVVLRDDTGSAVATISRPYAVDAQGTDVPVVLEAAGDRLTMIVPHRAGAFSYPIVADPAIAYNAGYNDEVISNAERAACVAYIGYSRCNTVGTVAGWAAAEAKRSGYPGQTDGIQDAYRHCLWNGFMTWRLGPDVAKRIADNHERFGRNRPAAHAMDDRNNKIGQLYGRPYVGARNHAAADNGVRRSCQVKGVLGRVLVWIR